MKTILLVQAANSETSIRSALQLARHSYDIVCHRRPKSVADALRRPPQLILLDRSMAREQEDSIWHILRTLATSTHAPVFTSNSS